MDKNCVRRLLIALACCWAQHAAAGKRRHEDRIVLGQSAGADGPAAQLGIQMRNGVMRTWIRQRAGRRATAGNSS